MNVNLVSEPKIENEPEQNLDPTKMMNITEQRKNFRELLLFINQNKDKEKMNKNEFDLNIIKKFDGKVIRKLINLMLEQTDRGKNALFAIQILEDLEQSQKNKSDVKPVVQKYINEVTNKYMYEPHGGKDAFEKKINQNNPS